VPSLLFYGWRVTYLNWRSVWAPPPNPSRWGAIPAADFAANLRNARAQALNGAREQWLREDTPLARLTETQLALVLEADGLYELIGVQVDADIETIRAAHRRRSKEWHPDLSQEASREATENMISLNQAWEILRSPGMREAYDWLTTQRQTESAA
jgi:DnaJ-domain-containing protein 1